MTLLFPPSDGARVFALPPGADFGAEVVQGVLDRLPGDDPMALARVELIVNTRRMQRRLHDVFAQGPARLLPRIRMVTDPAQDPTLIDLLPAISPLRRRLELSQLVAGLLEQETRFAPKSSLFAVSDSLAALLDEMHGEGVTIDDLAALNVQDESGHWAQALRFVEIAAHYLMDAETGPDAEIRRRAAIQAQIRHWQEHPPEHPVIVAGSTASRGTTAMLIEAIARLPQGAVILPGVDADMPAEIWDQLADPLTGEDHPQYRFARLCRALDLDPSTLPLWTQTAAPCPPRNKLISLALRPAPVTDGWLRDGPALTQLADATERVTLLEAPSPRLEAEAIALRMRQAVTDHQRVALITNDRVLTRQVSAALGRWNLVADDSAGEPLHLTPVGRLVRHVAAFLTAQPDAEGLITLLKHPLSHSGSDRGPHLRWTRELELSLRRYGPPYPDAVAMQAWAETRPDAAGWAAWVAGLLDQHIAGRQPLATRVQAHVALVEALAAGPEGQAEALWSDAAGRKAQSIMAELAQHAEAGADMTANEYRELVQSILSAEQVRQPDGAHPGLLIWGTLEARVQSVDLVILAGLNEGSWPEAPSPDPWLNRRMRAQAGMLLPERRIGLSAHDFQQAAAAQQVWLTRAVRSDEAETVASRWVNRLVNLLDGLTDGAPCLAAMRARGDVWIKAAEALDRPVRLVAPASRPSPRPPVSARPKQLRVTDISQLLRDPYAIYARSVLGLSSVPPLIAEADARIRGTAIHEVMERFVKEIDPLSADARADLLTLTDEVLRTHCPWPTARVMWLAQMARNADGIIAAEVQRRGRAAQVFVETSGKSEVHGVTLRGRADRIDVAHDGRAWLYDYKTGTAPSRPQQLALDKQLLVETAMVEHGGFEEVGALPVAQALYLQIGSKLAETAAPIADQTPKQIWADLHRLMAAWSTREQGYTARIAAQEAAFGGDYDQLSRYGEWDASHDPAPEDVG